MPLWMLAIAVPLGIALVVWLVKRTGGDMAPLFTDRQSAIDLVELEYPGSRVVMIEVGEAGRGAAYRLSDGQIGLIRQIGRNLVTRLTAPIRADIKTDGNYVFVSMGDAGFPPLTIEFPSHHAAKDFATKLKP
jgi:hypothetical protein